jgi:hypothetical protein
MPRRTRYQQGSVQREKLQSGADVWVFRWWEPMQNIAPASYTHNLFARYEPRTIELRNLLANPFWKYLGIKHEDQVRAVFREADAAGCIGKYVVADQLEQITTCFSLETFLEKKVRL